MLPALCAVGPRSCGLLSKAQPGQGATRSAGSTAQLGFARGDGGVAALSSVGVQATACGSFGCVAHPCASSPWPRPRSPAAPLSPVPRERALTAGLAPPWGQGSRPRPQLSRLPSQGWLEPALGLRSQLSCSGPQTPATLPSSPEGTPGQSLSPQPPSPACQGCIHPTEPGHGEPSLPGCCAVHPPAQLGGHPSPPVGPRAVESSAKPAAGEESWGVGSAAGGSRRLIRGTRASSAPSPERAAGARRPQRATTGAGPAEHCPAPPSPARPRGGAGARGWQRGPPPGTAPCGRSSPGPPRERLCVQQRRGAINNGGQRPSARCQHGGTAPGGSSPLSPPGSPPGPGPRGPCALSPGAAVAPCAPRGLLSPGAQLLLRPELAAALFVYFPAAVAGCQARGPFLLKTHFSCPARSGSLLAALRSAAKRKRGRVLPGAGGGGWSRSCFPLSFPPSLLPSLIPPGAAGGSRGASRRRRRAPGRGDRPRSRPSHFLPSGAAAKR